MGARGSSTGMYGERVVYNKIELFDLKQAQLNI